MKTKLMLLTIFLVLGCVFALLYVDPADALAQGRAVYSFPRAHPALGSWFGRAVPIEPFCTPGTAGCPLPPELFMTLNIADDGNFIGNDSLTFGAQHTTAHGQWRPLSRTEITANYVVLAGGASFANPKPQADGTLAVATPFLGAFRMRWQANAVDWNNMNGFVNVWFFPFNDPAKGIANIDPTTWVPKPDPLTNLGPFITDPKQCIPTQGCLGVFKFKIRRVNEE